MCIYKHIATDSFMYIFILFEVCIGIAPRGSKYTFLQGVIVVYV